MEDEVCDFSLSISQLPPAHLQTGYSSGIAGSMSWLLSGLVPVWLCPFVLSSFGQQMLLAILFPLSYIPKPPVCFPIALPAV